MDNAMRFKPLMLAPGRHARRVAPSASRTAGAWSALPPTLLKALQRADRSPMLQSYLLTGDWGFPSSNGRLPLRQNRWGQLDDAAQPSGSARLIRKRASTASAKVARLRSVSAGESDFTLARVMQGVKRKLSSRRRASELTDAKY